MSIQKFKSESYCVGGRHRSATKNIYSDISIKGTIVLIGYCSICNRKKAMTVSDSSIVAENSGVFFVNLGKKGLNVSKRMAKKILDDISRYQNKCC